ncbi:MAG: CinA family nicotinamide mononucleotide deamidase-related protein [Myxococcales bacterium]|nr:CinA family nicotinamide mononucleotide deamidase-related protein [Myxococcales bacterium]
MRIELLTVGDELLDGTVVDTNGNHIAGALHGRGLTVARAIRLPDRIEPLVAELRAIAERADLCVCTGGLGPTDDDLTLDALAAAAGVDRRFDARAWAWIERVYGDRTPPPSNRRQTLIPDGARCLYTEVGTAPGVDLQIGRCRFFAFPGVPGEMRWFVDRHLLPALAADGNTTQMRTLRFTGIGESDLAERVAAAGVPEGIEISYLARTAEVAIRLRGNDPALLGAAVAAVRDSAGDRFVGEGTTGLAEATLAACRAAGLTLGAAESCTGGLVGTMLTEISGASTVFNGSIVSYDNRVKTGVLGVSEAILERDGAVSEACARAMVAGARRALGCDVAVAITGVAGPGGGTTDKPVGTVHFAWAGPGLDGLARKVLFRGDRERIRHLAAAHAIDVIRRAALTLAAEQAARAPADPPHAADPAAAERGSKLTEGT